MQRQPSSRMMGKSSHVKNTSNVTVPDRCTGNTNSTKTKPKPPILSRTSEIPPPGRLTKQVRNAIPIRHTLTSKLRMEKANPLLTSSSVSGISEPAITGTPSRRSTFHLAMEGRKPEKKPVVLSIQNSQPKKPNTPAKKQLKSILRKSASVGDLRKTNIKSEDAGVLSEIENRPNSRALNKSLKSVAFYSPLHNSSFTPVNLVNTPPPSVLRKRLEDWLAKRGKSSLSYRHLCCFGLPKNMPIIPPKMNNGREREFGKTKSGDSNDNDAEPRLNETITLETSVSQPSYSHENNHEVDIENSPPKDSSTPEHGPDRCDENKENVAYLSHPEVLDDLKKLVHSGYPRDQCEHWLSLISKSHPTLKEMPQYWECLAALEEARGDFSSAVDCYGRAIVKGADADDVDECLDDLWEKFCTLSVNSVENKRTPTKKLAIDTKQIFKSTVIKFALQQKAVKRSINNTEGSMPVNYIVTPVRRSSRRSVSRFRTTPTMKCVDKLEDIEQNIRETMEFHGNAVLNPGN